MKMLAVLLIILILIAVYIFIESYNELRSFQITTYKVKDKNVPESLRDKTLCFVSDYHEAVGGRNNRKITEVIEKEKPDYILIGGDMINGREGEDVSPALELMNTLSKRHELFYCYGNHERKCEDNLYNSKEVMEEFSKGLSDRVHIVNNKSVYLNGYDSSGGVLCGLDIPSEYYKRLRRPEMTVDVMESLIGKKQDKEYVILLAHDPENFGAYKEWNANLVLSGHIHGGLIRTRLLGALVSPRLSLFPRYSYGKYTEDDSTLIVTNGIGQHSLKIKINNIPEAVIIKFE